MSGLDPELADLWTRMGPVALQRAERVLDACDGAVDASDAADEVHKLAGSLGMYGLAEAAQLAAEADQLVRDGALHDERTSELRAVAVALRDAIARTV